MDLSHYFYTTLKHDLRRNHLKEVVKFYFEALKETVEKLNASFPYSFEVRALW
jgi:hypothetical protein